MEVMATERENLWQEKAAAVEDEHVCQPGQSSSGIEEDREEGRLKDAFHHCVQARLGNAASKAYLIENCQSQRAAASYLMIYYGQGQFNDAGKDSEKAAELASQVTLPYIREMEAAYKSSVIRSHVRFLEGAIYMFGFGSSSDYERSFPLLLEAAKLGHAAAMSNTGYCLYHGRGTAQDKKEAVRWFRESADRYYVVGLSNMGSAYESGDGVPKNSAEAVRYFRLAAELGYVDAMMNLASCYVHGKGVNTSPAEGFRLYTYAVMMDYPAAFNSYGWCHEFGKGVDKSLTLAVYWYTKAAVRGYLTAQTNLGNCYYSGIGTPVDYDEALKWFRLAADRKQARAQFHVGRCYELGHGVAIDMDEAMRWYSLAAAQDYPQGKAAKERLETARRKAEEEAAGPKEPEIKETEESVKRQRVDDVESTASPAAVPMRAAPMDVDEAVEVEDSEEEDTEGDMEEDGEEVDEGEQEVVVEIPDTMELVD